MGFDTLSLARDLEAAGFTPKQAEGTATALAKGMVGQVPTRTDVELIVERSKNEILRWMIPLFLAQLGAIVALFFKLP